MRECSSVQPGSSCQLPEPSGDEFLEVKPSANNDAILAEVVYCKCDVLQSCSEKYGLGECEGVFFLVFVCERVVVVDENHFVDFSADGQLKGLNSFGGQISPSACLKEYLPPSSHKSSAISTRLSLTLEANSSLARLAKSATATGASRGAGQSHTCAAGMRGPMLFSSIYNSRLNFLSSSKKGLHV